LLTAETVHELIAHHQEQGSAATVLTARLADPTGYGRIVRASDGQVRAIVEQRDADASVAAIGEVNSGIYVFDAERLGAALQQVTRDNSQGEEYLTDVIGVLVSGGERVDAIVVQDPREVLGVNDRAQLAEAAVVMRGRINDRCMRAGVTIVDPSTTWIEPTVQLEPDAVILPWTMLEGTTMVAAGAQVGPGSHLIDTVVGSGAVACFTTAHGAEIGEHASVGPYTYLRPGTRLAARTRAGAFVETKNAVVGEGSKVPHLSYVGDAEIGEGSNIGAATVFVNYDGVAKHRTVIGDHVRVGSDTMLVAPVSIGDGAYTAAGSVITDDVPAGAMGVGRARQRTIRDWVLRKRRGTESAAAAERSQQSAQSGADSDAERPSGDNDLAAPSPGVQNDPEGSGA
jgi:bifunctional UDP-N-acetylglucosamine pyrophosphorylase/glucosamine-1-phosphate N-acetyltransferase